MEPLHESENSNLCSSHSNGISQQVESCGDALENQNKSINGDSFAPKLSRLPCESESEPKGRDLHDGNALPQCTAEAPNAFSTPNASVLRTDASRSATALNVSSVELAKSQQSDEERKEASASTAHRADQQGGVGAGGGSHRRSGAGSSIGRGAPGSSNSTSHLHSSAGPVNVMSRRQFRVDDGLNLYVAQVPPSYNSTRLRDAFAKFGPIHSAKVIRDSVTNESRCFGFVLFERAQDGYKAMTEMNDITLEEGSGRLHVRVAKPSALPQPLKDDACEDNGVKSTVAAPESSPQTIPAQSPTLSSLPLSPTHVSAQTLPVGHVHFQPAPAAGTYLSSHVATSMLATSPQHPQWQWQAVATSGGVYDAVPYSSGFQTPAATHNFHPQVLSMVPAQAPGGQQLAALYQPAALLPHPSSAEGSATAQQQQQTAYFLTSSSNSSQSAAPQAAAVYSHFVQAPILHASPTLLWVAGAGGTPPQYMTAAYAQQAHPQHVATIPGAAAPPPPPLPGYQHGSAAYWP